MQIINGYIDYGLLSYFITYVLMGTPLFLGTYLIHKDTNIFTSLGLKSNILTALIASIAFTLPMSLGGLIFYHLQRESSISNLIAGTLFAGFFEELYFRGFLFGLLFRYTKLGFIPAIIAGALIFAAGHLYQSHELSVQAAIFLTTFMGAGFFAWLYAEWNYNLWIPILLHTLMNLWWMVFDMSEHAAGDISSNFLRALTIIFAIVTTLIYKLRRGKRLIVNKDTLWMKRALSN